MPDDYEATSTTPIPASLIAPQPAPLGQLRPKPSSGTIGSNMRYRELIHSAWGREQRTQLPVQFVRSSVHSSVARFGGSCHFVPNRPEIGPRALSIPIGLGPCKLSEQRRFPHSSRKFYETSDQLALATQCILESISAGRDMDETRPQFDPDVFQVRSVMPQYSRVGSYVLLLMIGRPR